MNKDNIREITIKVFPEIGNAYKVTIDIDYNKDIEEQVDSWIDENLKLVQTWDFEQEVFYDSDGNVVL